MQHAHHSRHGPHTPCGALSARDPLPQIPPLLQPGDDLVGGFLGAGLGGVDPDLGGARGLIGRVDAGEVLDLAGAGLLVEALVPSPPIMTTPQRATDSSGPRRSRRLLRWSVIRMRTSTRCQPMRSGRVRLGRLSAGSVDFAACPNLTDVRSPMSVYRSIPDVFQRGAECVFLTRLGHQPYQSTTGGRLAALQAFRRARSRAERIIQISQALSGHENRSLRLFFR